MRIEFHDRNGGKISGKSFEFMVKLSAYMGELNSEGRTIKMKRYVGVLLSITSLPSKYGIGCFDQAAYDFVDWLEKSGQKYWQILPLGSTSHGGAYDSPYQAYSAFAGNPYFISLDALIKEGVLTEEECAEVDFGSDPNKVDYDLLSKNRLPLLRKAYERSEIYKNEDFKKFCDDNFWWLDDYALFLSVRSYLGGKGWTQWPEDIRMHYGPALDYYRGLLYFDIEFRKYLQFKFYEQWSALKKYANDKNIEIVGDIPIYVSPDGSDVWAQPELFQLDENNQMVNIAGCPPDDFSADGQVWGNPLYNWEYHKKTNYHWWVTRLWYSFKLYDVVRIDHFRGFDEYFSIPSATGKAKDGHWEKGPGMELFETLEKELGDRKFIAEDLGHMTDGVRKLVKDSGFPNMKVLQFAWNVADTTGVNDYLPHNFGSNNVVYTGTHDNETVAGWYASLTAEGKEQIRDYIDDHHTADADMYKKIIRMAMMCASETCIVPMQDWAGLDNSARMNTPGTVDNNWSWRMSADLTTDELSEEVLALTKRFNRANWAALDAVKKAKEEADKKAAEAAKLAAIAAVDAADIDADDDAEGEIILSVDGQDEDIVVAFELEDHAEIEIEMEIDDEEIVVEVEMEDHAEVEMELEIEGEDVVVEVELEKTTESEDPAVAAAIEAAVKAVVARTDKKVAKTSRKKGKK